MYGAGPGARLTVVMTFVINLGVPPLLFAQVLYGRALYTSSVLIGDLLDRDHSHADSDLLAALQVHACGSRRVSPHGGWD